MRTSPKALTMVRRHVLAVQVAPRHLQHLARLRCRLESDRWLMRATSFHAPGAANSVLVQADQRVVRGDGVGHQHVVAAARRRRRRGRGDAASSGASASASRAGRGSVDGRQRAWSPEASGGRRSRGAGGARCADLGRNALHSAGSVSMYGPPIRSTQYGTAAKMPGTGGTSRAGPATSRRWPSVARAGSGSARGRGSRPPGATGSRWARSAG